MNFNKLPLSELVPKLMIGAASAFQVVLTLALATIAGTLLIGGLGGSLAKLAGAETIAGWLPGVGWIVGGIVGLSSEVGRVRNTRREPDKVQSADAKHGGDSKQDYKSLRFRVPTLMQILKSLGIGGLAGALAGIVLTLLLCVLLLSVTLSPFTPAAWRPTTRAPTTQERLEERQRGVSAEGVRTNFYHPGFRPIAVYSMLGSTLVGIALGGGLSCFAEVERQQPPNDESKQIQ